MFKPQPQVNPNKEIVQKEPNQVNIQIPEGAGKFSSNSLIVNHDLKMLACSFYMMVISNILFLYMVDSCLLLIISIQNII